MAGSVFDSPLFTHLFPIGDAGRLFTDTADVRAMMLVEGTLAKVQGEMGIIPEDSAFFIHRASMENQIDPSSLAKDTGQNGVSVPALVTAFRKAMEAPEHSQYMHWGATSQDIIDTALMLRLRQLLALCEADLKETLKSLASLANDHASTPMAARTWGQHATVTSFGAQCAEWGAPLLGLLKELPQLRATTLLVSLAGAAGTANALGPQAPQIRENLAAALGLADPLRSWHVDRTPVLAIAGWLTRVTIAYGKIGEDLTAFLQTGIAEISVTATGGSSTMPQKQNPVAPSALIAVARQTVGLNATLLGAGMPRHQRDGAAWFTEWMTLPQICLGTASAGIIAKNLVTDIVPNTDAMQSALAGNLDLIHAEAVSFALTDTLSRPEAQAATKALAQEAAATNTPLFTLLARDFPALDLAGLCEPSHQMGQAPHDAARFASDVKTLFS